MFYACENLLYDKDIISTHTKNRKKIICLPTIPVIRWSSTSDFLARPVDFCCSWSSKPTEFLCVMQKGDNLDQQKNSEDQ